MPTKTTKKLNKRAKQLKKGKKLEATKPLTSSSSTFFKQATGGSAFKQVFVGI